jgi:hypothetical protein
MQNYKIILNELMQACSHIKSFPQIIQQKLSDLESVALNFIAIQSDRIFPEYKIERSMYSRRWRKLLQG